MVYDVSKTIEKSWKYLLFFGIPTILAYFVNFYPSISGLTVGTIITALANWLKHKK
ncbi:hypothetical protein LCGC14_1047430 [marine sediment metagenome]|uniref:Uncharacterized protein n=1 Tax=marine sediment metagenome TaxID=412755 RepID=A0A0F9QW13_9ZZZZ